ncbi:hypothetical protein BC936DRAFT_140706 [Jimgerdemannia flammicorona]|uniref:Uncharacterized protein n=2 Tax=Jimgerdemannia flammicorona TaxID=994334 RepID=A0A433QR94_9FUNG|nr:hypothetical protein BC936DRAFT_140706 [Jimgerdemannia flammicorona]RUS32278.1 hypothetical protein BC938DRAFT_475859 [Jimgerdemannia flammicorona]
MAATDIPNSRKLQNFPAYPEPTAQKRLSFPLLDNFLDNLPSLRNNSIRKANSRKASLMPDSPFAPYQYDDDNPPLQQRTANSRTVSMYSLPPSNNPNNPYYNRINRDSTPITNGLDSNYTVDGFQDPFAIAPVDAWARIKDHNLSVNGLPTLDQVLKRKTRPPLGQFNFFAYLRNVHKAEENLNFWFEVDTHEKLWRAYTASQRRKLEKESRTKQQRISKRMSELLGPGFGTANPKPSDPDANPNANRCSVTSEDEQFEQWRPPQSPGHEEHELDELSSAFMFEDEQFVYERRLSGTANLIHRDPDALSYSSRIIPGSDISHKPGGALTLEDLEANANRIYQRYCSPYEAERQIYLPEDHRLALYELLEVHHLADPIIFESSKGYVYDILNIHFYPRFIEAAGATNLTRTSCLVALVLGVVFLTGGFALEFCFIFLNYWSRVTRLWGLLPIWFGWLGLFTNVTEFLCLLTAFGISETRFLHYDRIVDGAIIRQHHRRAITLYLYVTLFAILNTAIFCAVPPHPLVNL